MAIYQDSLGYHNNNNEKLKEVADELVLKGEYGLAAKVMNCMKPINLWRSFDAVYSGMKMNLASRDIRYEHSHDELATIDICFVIMDLESYRSEGDWFTDTLAKIQNDLGIQQ